MKAKIAVIIMLFFFIGIISYSYTKSIYDNEGPHGGRLKSVDNFNIEVKVVSPGFHVYLLDKQLNSINNKGMSCEIRFFLYDNTILDVALKPFGNDGFMVESSLTGYHSYNVIFYAFGKQIKAKFEAENIIVLNK